MLDFNGILGHENIKQHLKAAIASGKPSHAYIFNGEEGSVGMTWTNALNEVGNYANSHPIVIGSTTYATSSHGSSSG